MKYTKTKFKWDLGLDYEKIKKDLINKINKIKHSDKKRDLTRLSYLIIACIQLRNGLRASESYEAFEKFLKGEYKKKREKIITMITIRKKKKGEYKEVKYPEFIKFDLINKLRKDKMKISLDGYKMFCIRRLKINSHSLRYSRITYLLEKGINPSIVAKITKHSKLDFILEYTQEKIAEKFDENII